MDHTPRKLLARSRELRVLQTPAERAMWDALRGRRFMNLKFRRQEEIGYYIADFCCPEVRLIIELDGALHMHPLIQKEDARRTRYLESRGYTVMRIENEELRENFLVVLNRLRRLVETLRELPHP